MARGSCLLCDNCLGDLRLAIIFGVEPEFEYRKEGVTKYIYGKSTHNNQINGYICYNTNEN